jgi:hypothetical protein
MSRLISYTDFNTNALTISEPTKKQIADDPQKTYFSMPFTYTKEGAAASNDVRMECCKMTTTRGLLFQKNENGRMDYSIQSKYSPKNSEHVLFLQKFQEIYEKCVEAVFLHRKTVKVPLFNKSMPEATGFKNPIYRPKDEITDEVLTDKDASIFLKPFYMSPTFKTKFLDLNEKELDWNLLKDVQFDYVPVLKFKHIHIGSKISMQINISSAYITDIRPMEQYVEQKESLMAYNTNNKDAAAALEAKIAELLNLQKELKKSMNEGNGESEHVEKKELEENIKKEKELEKESEKEQEKELEKSSPSKGIPKPENFGDIKKLTKNAPKRK